jgi:predicted ATPase with chaperone activity
MLKDNQIPDPIPDQPTSIEEIGLPEGFLLDLTLKNLYTEGTMQGKAIASKLKLPFGSVLREVLDHLEDEEYVEVKGGGQFADQWEYQITGEGRERVREIFEEDRYIGPAPVPLDQYDEITQKFAVSDEKIQRADLERAFGDLQVRDEYFEVFGPAVNSGRSVFVYGEPGNGKTVMCERVIESFDDFVGIPHAIYAGGSVIKVFDEHHHDAQPVEDQTIDQRWNVCRRPFISVGGELTMDELDLIYNPDIGYYEAPFQMKANTGLLLIDDFGRQQMPPGELLNRWIVPLEKRRDFLTLHTGQKIDVPFEMLVFYSTNLDPEELVDEAFLRRLRYKIHTRNPDEEEFRELFRAVCDNEGLNCDDRILDYLIREHYDSTGRSMRRCHPRDLIETIEDFCRYREESLKLTEELLDEAAETYFPDNVMQDELD